MLRQHFVLNVKTLLTPSRRRLSVVTSLDKEILSFLEHDAQETFSRQSAKIKNTRTYQVISKQLKSVENEAGILVPICVVNMQPSLLFTVRARHLNSHAGEISFPGGKKDSSDNSIIDAALRETHEEISINKEKVRVFTSLGPFTSRRVNVAITAVIAFIGDINVDELIFNQNEVSEVFTVPIANLVTEHRNRYTQFRSGWCMPVFLSKPYHIWGITANVTDCVLSMITPLNYKNKFMYRGTGVQNSFITDKENMQINNSTKSKR